MNQEFLNELYAVLKKYDGSINYVEHGGASMFNNSCIIVAVPKKNSNGLEEEVILTVEKSYISADDIPTTT